MEGGQKQLDPVKTIVGVAMFIPSIGIPVFFATVAAKVLSTLFNAIGSIAGGVPGSSGTTPKAAAVEKTTG